MREKESSEDDGDQNGESRIELHPSAVISKTGDVQPTTGEFPPSQSEQIILLPASCSFPSASPYLTPFASRRTHTLYLLLFLTLAFQVSRCFFLHPGLHIVGAVACAPSARVRSYLKIG
jgi:hypothetical protein